MHITMTKRKCRPADNQYECFPTPEWLKNLVLPLKEQPEVLIGGGCSKGRSSGLYLPRLSTFTSRRSGNLSTFTTGTDKAPISTTLNGGSVTPERGEMISGFTGRSPAQCLTNYDLRQEVYLLSIILSDV